MPRSSSSRRLSSAYLGSGARRLRRVRRAPRSGVRMSTRCHLKSKKCRHLVVCGARVVEESSRVDHEHLISRERSDPTLEMQRKAALEVVGQTHPGVVLWSEPLTLRNGLAPVASRSSSAASAPSNERGSTPERRACVIASKHAPPARAAERSPSRRTVVQRARAALHRPDAEDIGQGSLRGGRGTGPTGQSLPWSASRGPRPGRAPVMGQPIPADGPAQRN